MAPFKLKFRMSSSRCSSQEHSTDPQVVEALLPNHQPDSIAASYSTIDSTDWNSLASMTTNDRKSLLPHTTNSLPLGYLNRQSSQEHHIASISDGTVTVPTTPPPLYELVVGKCQYIEKYLDSTRHGVCLSHEETNDKAIYSDQSYAKRIAQCDDADSLENSSPNEQSKNGNNESSNSRRQRQKSVTESSKLLISTTMKPTVQENFEMENCAYNYQPCNGSSEGYKCDCTDVAYATVDGNDNQNSTEESNEQTTFNLKNSECGGTVLNGLCDPLINHMGYCTEETHYDNDFYEHSELQPGSYCGSSWNVPQSLEYGECQHEHQNMQQQFLSPEIMSNKSSKELYKSLAKQWGITCKMTDGCRCMDCQSHYFDCEFDDNEHQKTDGGLGAGTPMFLSEVMHGSACTLL